MDNLASDHSAQNWDEVRILKKRKRVFAPRRFPKNARPGGEDCQTKSSMNDEGPENEIEEDFEREAPTDDDHRIARRLRQQKDRTQHDSKIPLRTVAEAGDQKEDRQYAEKDRSVRRIESMKPAMEVVGKTLWLAEVDSVGVKDDETTERKQKVESHGTAVEQRPERSQGEVLRQIEDRIGVIEDDH